ncbi:hypothetical protein [Spirosoma sp. 209]|uniref:hypothetical protein n=1 Tax=Spirosoma sp. 209 TaxID=1955701 RepID=UPI00098CF909|nr:hypothetical protein [Spirosoma sp. 209]
MNFPLFCYILNDNLAFEPAATYDPDDWKEDQQDWYTDFKETYWATDAGLSDKERVIGWMRESFFDVTFNTHRFALKVKDEWTDASIQKPPKNLGVLVFLPKEDGHITSGMWDVDDKWVLLDECRVPDTPVTHWQLLPEPPKDYTL